MSSSLHHIESLDRDSPKSRRRVRRLLGLPRDAAITIPQISMARRIAQYSDLKSELPADTLLAIRIGDFLEFFGEDAERAAKVLRLSLTHRLGVPMAGIPFHGRESYAAKLIAAGCTVAFANEEKQSLRVLCP